MTRNIEPNMTRTPSSRRVPRWFIFGLLILLVGVAIYVYYQFIVLEGPIPEGAGTQYTELEQGYTAQGFPRLGSADAPVLVENFSSYACPHCRNFHDERFPNLLDEIAAGEVQFVFVPVPHIGPGAKNAARALLCAGEQGQLWTMHDVLYYWNDRFLARPFDEKRLLDGVQNLGLDTAAFESCLDSEDINSAIDTARTEFRRRGLTGTPSFFINGEKVQDYREFDNLDALVEKLQAD